MITMETLHFDYPATQPVRQRTHVGVVGSGDLEVLLEPSADEWLTSPFGPAWMVSAQIWKHVMDRFFSRYQGAAAIEINDFGATPGNGRPSSGAGSGKEPAMTQPDQLDPEQFLRRKSFIELSARERAQALLDDGPIVNCSDHLTVSNRLGCQPKASFRKRTMD